jgi:hypothetical protein
MRCSKFSSTARAAVSSRGQGPALFSYRRLAQSGPLMPVLPVTLVGPGGESPPLMALVDSGADSSLFPVQIAPLVGVDLTGCEKATGRLRLTSVRRLSPSIHIDFDDAASGWPARRPASSQSITTCSASLVRAAASSRARLWPKLPRRHSCAQVRRALTAEKPFQACAGQRLAPTETEHSFVTQDCPGVGDWGCCLRGGGV